MWPNSKCYRSKKERGESATSLVILIVGLGIFYYIGMFLYDAMQAEKARRAGFSNVHEVSEPDSGTPEYIDVTY